MTVPNTILLTGVPRSGTTLCCKIINSTDNCVALSEPMDMSRVERSTRIEGVLDYIANFVGQARAQILVQKRAPSKQVAGAVPDNPIEDHISEHGLRALLVDRGEITIDKSMSNDFRLVIKHNALFAALLPDLQRHYSCYAVIRNPLSVLASWNSVDLPVNRGRVPMGELFAPELKGKLDNEPDPIARQILVLEWFFNQYQLNLSPDHILKYEDIVASRGKALSCITESDDDVLIPLTNKNANELYDKKRINQLCELLLQRDGWYLGYYTRAQIEAMAVKIIDGP